MDDTRVRFLRAIATQLEVERIAEVHLFPAIRQGGMESGVAVLALELVGEVVPSAADTTIVASDEPAQADEASEPVAESTSLDVEQITSESEVVVDAEVSDDAITGDDVASPYADDDALELDALEPDADFADDESNAQDSGVAAPRPAPRRFTVYTARYRHTLKGPDRGKWEVSVTEEADAPLLTVDAVVRGVQRRSGDVDEIVRLTGEEVSALTATAASSTR
ncbi:MAG TPA: hypothetical protein VGP25_12020 [Gemmatimonadaceae bacterium]|jgi:hypothetical protein|nr:hypothetical protein [Gemmatimonadaceae bacterium]